MNISNNFNTTNFNQLLSLPILDLQDELVKLKDAGLVNWFQKSNGEYIADQICITSINGQEDNIFYGRGSLYLDWDNSYNDSKGNLQAPLRDTPLQEIDFCKLCTPFIGTLFETAFIALTEKYHIGRMRVMNSKPKTCLTWHIDDTYRIHYPMKTQEGCFMVIEDEIRHLPKYTWWETDTLKSHTAFNASTQIRTHLVVNVIGTK